MTLPVAGLRRRLFAFSLAAAPLGVPAQAAPMLSVSGAQLGGAAQGHRVWFDRAALEALPQHKVATRTPWFDGPREFAGPLLRDVLGAAGAPGDFAGVLRCTALNDFRVDIPAGDARLYDVVVALRRDGKPMAVRDKGPLFVIYPFDEYPQLRNSVYYSRCIWQLKAIELL